MKEQLNSYRGVATTTTMIIIPASFVFFLLVYSLHRRLQPEKCREWSVRLTTMIHGALVTTLAYVSCFLLGPWPFHEPGLDSNSFHLAVMSVCLGYFIFDYLWCLRYGSGQTTTMMHVHHWFSLVYLGWGLSSRTSGAEIVGVIFGSEVTNPMLQLRWMLKRSGKYETTILGRINDVVFAVTFVSVRCVVGGYFLYRVASHERPSTTVKVGGALFYSISCVFAFQVVAFSRRKMAEWNQGGGFFRLTPTTTTTAAPNSTTTKEGDSDEGRNDADSGGKPETENVVVARGGKTKIKKR